MLHDSFVGLAAILLIPITLPRWTERNWEQNLQKRSKKNDIWRKLGSRICQKSND